MSNSKIYNTIFGDPNKKVLAELQTQVEKINALEPEIKKLSDSQLKAKTEEFKKRLADGQTLDQIMIEAFAVVREAAWRALGQRHFDVQMIGAITLHRGNIAEMRTGEGKTLTATAPLYLNALTGKGAHLVTVNDYLAKLHAVWMGQIFHFLGLTSGCIQHESGYIYDPDYKFAEGSEKEEAVDKERDELGSFKVETDYLRPVSRKEAYAVDITYGTNNEFGFDYLRDNMVSTLDQMVQRDLHYAIVDEVDSILIDEARTPLIISAPDTEASDQYYRYAQLVRILKENEDYNIDEKMRTAILTQEGISKMEKALNVENLYVEGGIKMVHHLEQALRAEVLFKIDRDYVVKDKEIIIVDEFTGRMMYGRRYSEGLHQAIEAKEGVEIKRESRTMATITFQNYFRMYEKLAGMTGTAATEAEEFASIYNLEVTQIPTNKPDQRRDLGDRIYKSEIGKFKAVVVKIKELQESGQPVLVGTASIDKNEILSEMLAREGIEHNLLNAKNHEKEAEFVAQAGRVGAVTVATNMAGRGVDIKLGGNPKDEEQEKRVLEMGGLFVLGTERHESRRIDNQLRGRSARQGDPGTTQFFVSMEDDLMRIFASDRVRSIMDRIGIPEDMPIENKMVTGSIEKAQTRVEGHHFDMRKHVLEYDDVLNKHREVVYKLRRDIINKVSDEDAGSLRSEVEQMIEDEIESVVAYHTGEGDFDANEIVEVASTVVPLTAEAKEEIKILASQAVTDKLHLAQLRTQLIEKTMESARLAYGKLVELYDNREELKLIERSVLLRSIDNLWVEHLDLMTALRTSIGLRGYGQRDPLIEYKKEAYGMFNRLLGAINQEVVNNFFKYATSVGRAKRASELGKGIFERAGVILQGADKGGKESPFAPNGASGDDRPSGRSKVGRNEPCPCGSEKKYKKCCGA
ncbi:MAG: preprotein translocase subunit SecA [Candidatus Uhrbacteria bacterium]